MKKGVNHLERDDELRNQDEPLAVLAEAYAPSWEISVRMYPDTLAFLLGLVLGPPVTTAGDGIITDLGGTAIPVGAHRHRWTAPFGPAGASPRTADLNVAYKDQAVFYRGKGAAISEMSLETPEEGGGMIAASGPVNFLDTIADPVLVPAYEALSVRPFIRGNLTLPQNLAGTGTVEDFSLAVANPVEQVRSLGIASRYPDVIEKDNEGPIVVSGEIPHRQLDQQDIDALEAATGFVLRAQWVSDTIITGSYPYKFGFKADNAQYMEGEADELANRRRHGHSFSWKSTTASTGSSTFEVVNATTSYI